MMSPELVVGTGATLLGVIGKWVWDIDRKVTTHEAVINKMDQLIDALLTKELAKRP